MLQQFSWQAFLIAVGIMALLWYLGVILFFYRSELNAFLGSKKNNGNDVPLPHRWEEKVEKLSDAHLEPVDELMGKPRLPEGMAVVSSEEINFMQAEDSKYAQIGLVPDVLQELKAVFAVLAKQDGHKKDFFGLMEMVRQNFPAIGSNPNIVQINAFISEHAPFHLSAEELENLWD